MRSAVLLLAILCSGCSRSGAADSGCPPRSGRFGSLRDFVLVDVAIEGRVVPLFVDRFEVTRGDWREFSATAEGRAVAAADVPSDGNPALPVGQVDLAAARAFARWRFARLPRAEEWQQVATNNEHNTFPWGSKEDATRANTGELGLGEAVPVGTFESGRRAGSDQPYDLIGNVSEWAESVPQEWFGYQLDPLASLHVLHAQALRSPALAVWQGPGGILPLVTAVAAGGRYVPHEVVGSDFLGEMNDKVQIVLAGDRRARTGLRLWAAPRELLYAMLATDAVPTPADLEQVRRFLRRDRHSGALAAEWSAALARLARRGEGPHGSLGELLRRELAARDGR